MSIQGDKLLRRRVLVSIIKIILILMFGFIAIAGGLLVGKIIVGKFDTFDPTKYTAESYIESPQNVALWSSKNINELTPTQIFCVAESNILKCENYSIKTKGYDGEDKGVVIALGVRQDLYGYRYRNGNKGYFDYFSTSSLATVVKKTEFLFGDDKYYCYEGSMNGDNTNWEIKKTESGSDFFSSEEYKAMTGCDAENPIDYIVSTKTVTSEQTNGKEGNIYSYTLILDTKASVLNYVKKMDYMSGFGYPKFNSVELQFEVDENMNFQNIRINESYKVIGMDANSKYKMEFEYDGFEIR